MEIWVSRRIITSRIIINILIIETPIYPGRLTGVGVGIGDWLVLLVGGFSSKFDISQVSTLFPNVPEQLLPILEAFYLKIWKILRSLTLNNVRRNLV